jgi:hypothetical protein
MELMGGSDCQQLWKREKAGPAKWIELTAGPAERNTPTRSGPAERNTPTRIKGGLRVATGLIEKRVRNGIGKKDNREMMSWTIKNTEKD